MQCFQNDFPQACVGAFQLHSLFWWKVLVESFFSRPEEETLNFTKNVSWQLLCRVEAALCTTSTPGSLQTLYGADTCYTTSGDCPCQTRCSHPLENTLFRFWRRGVAPGLSVQEAAHDASKKKKESTLRYLQLFFLHW